MVFGAVLGTLGNIYAANKSASSAKGVTQAQINWERERAQNAHQWEIKDLEKAGLNPALSAGGSGAQTTGIAGAMPDTSGYQNIGTTLMNSAKNIADIINQTKTTDATVDNLNAQTNTIKEKTPHEINQIDTQSAKMNSDIKLNSAKIELAQQESIQKQYENALLELEKIVNTGNYGKALKYIDRTVGTLKGVGGAGAQFAGMLAGLKMAGSAKGLLSNLDKLKNVKISVK